MYPENRSGWIVAGGDVLLIVAVVIVGQLSHDISPVSDPLRTAGTVLPFLVGWLLLAGLLDLYRGPRIEDLQTAIRSVLAAWFGAVGVGLVGRTSPSVEGGAAWPFGLVITGTVLAVLLPWRLVAARVLEFES